MVSERAAHQKAAQERPSKIRQKEKYANDDYEKNQGINYPNAWLNVEFWNDFLWR